MARRGEVVPREEELPSISELMKHPPGYVADLIAKQIGEGYRRSQYVVPNELTQERASWIADMMKANEQLRLGREQFRMWETAVKVFEFQAELYAAAARSHVEVNSALMDLQR